MDDAGDEPLCSIVAEQAVLGSLLYHGVDLEAALAARGFGAEDYHDPVHGAIHREVSALVRAGQVADAISMAGWAVAHEGVRALGGRTYLAELMAASTSQRTALEYAQFVADLASRRQLRSMIGGAGARLASEPAITVIEDLEGCLHAMRCKRSTRQDILSSAEAATQAADAIVEAFEAGAGYPPDAILTGLNDLDRLTRGWRPGQFIVAAARASMGKSLFALHAALEVARGGGGVLYISLEMSARENMERAAAMATALSYTDISAGALDDGGLVSVTDALSRLARAPIEWSERGGLTPDDIGAMVRRRQRQTLSPPLRLVVVDHAGLVRAPGRGQYETQSAVVDGLKDVAQSCGVPLLCVAQINRGVEARDNKRPTLADLRDTGKFEENAHQVLLLYRDAYYAEREPACTDSERDLDRLTRAESRTLEIDVAKNRAGRIGRATIYCDVQTGKLADLHADLRDWRYQNETALA